MIAVSIHDVDAAEPHLDEGSAWVTLRLRYGSRITIHTVNFGQAVAIADAINIEREARPSFDPLPTRTSSEAQG